MSFVEADAPRVNCPTHGPTVIEVPWARHNVGHTRAFDDVVAWLAVHASKTAVVELMSVAWATVGAIVGRVVDDAEPSPILSTGSGGSGSTRSPTSVTTVIW